MAFVLLFFGVGALLLAGLTLFISISIPLQILLFIVGSIVTLLGLRRYLIHYVPNKLDDMSYKGEEACVVSAIIEGPLGHPAYYEGYVEFHGTSWRARSEQKIAKAQWVRIKDRRDLLLYVEALDMDQKSPEASRPQSSRLESTNQE